MEGADWGRRREHRRQRAVPVLVFALTLAVTAALWVLAYQYVLRRDRLRLETERYRVELALLGRMESQIALLQNTAAMFVTQRDVTPLEFKRYVQTIDMMRRYDGIQGLGYAAWVPRAERVTVEREMRLAVRPDFVIHPAGDRDAVVVLLVEPRTVRNRNAIGFDISSEETRRRTFERARDRGEPTLSPLIYPILIPSERDQPAFLMAFPIYRNGDPQDLKARRANLRGFVYSSFRARNFFPKTFHQTSSQQLWVEVYDGTRVSPETLLYTNLPNAPLPVGVAYQKTVQVAGHDWTIRYRPNAEFLAASGEPVVQWLPWGGLFIALLLAGLSYGQVRANDALVAQADELHRREFRQGLLARSGQILAGSLDADENLKAVATLAVPSFADWCAVDVLESDGSIRRVAVTHVDAQKVRWAQEIQERYPPDPAAKRGVPEVLRTGNSELYPIIPPELVRSSARDEEHRRLIDEIGFSSAIVVPMTTRDRTIGAITFVWAESGCHYDEEDLKLAEEIGTRAAVSVENALLFAERDREITVRTAAEAWVREVNENLERLVAERTRELTVSNQELEAFAYSVSHDLRGPLRSVDGFSKALIEDYGDRLDAEGLDYLSRVRQAARRMDELITSLLALSRLTRAELHIQPTDLTEIAHEAADDLCRNEPNRVEVEVEPGLKADADPRMVRIVFDNLIGNAVKFSALGESPRVQVGRSNGAFFVRDNGVGFNPAYANKLFAPFERLHSSGEFPGTGIGLATVQRIVARHGGKVWAESEEGRGATFYFTLT